LVGDPKTPALDDMAHLHGLHVACLEPEIQRLAETTSNVEAYGIGGHLMLHMSPQVQMCVQEALDFAVETPDCMGFKLQFVGSIDYVYGLMTALRLEMNRRILQRIYEELEPFPRTLDRDIAWYGKSRSIVNL
jgi:hypothetical protein